MSATRSKDYLSLRKRLKKKAGREYQHAEMFWAGGVLYFGNAENASWPRMVPNVQNVPKPGHFVVGWAECHYNSQRQPIAHSAAGNSYRDSGYDDRSRRRW